jgi:PHD/YefM family antitoxin component YafN of YafNO toxin-antitoxin module
MEYLSVKDLTASPKTTWAKLSRAGEIAITNNGKPTAVMIRVDESGFDETVKSIRQAKAMRLLNRIWSEAEQRGPISDSEIEAEIAAARTAANARRRTTK